MARRRAKFDKADGISGILFPPASNWSPPREFPNLDGVKAIGLDIESRDPELQSKGPGFIRRDAHVAGISIATVDRSWYFPIGHLGGGNMDQGGVTAFIQDLVKDPNRSIIGANLQYELEGLSSEGIEVHSRCIDTQIAEALINEEALSNSLENLCKRYLGGSKDESLLRDAARDYGFTDVKANLWKMPAKYVGPYGEYDAQAPLLIFQKQLKMLEAENLLPIFELESKLLPLLWQMRKRGIRMDLEKAHNISKELKMQEDKLRQHMRVKYGTDVDEWSGGQLAMICDRLGIIYPRTAIGNPSFVADFIEGTNHPFLDDLSDLRELSKMRETFVDGWILDNAVGEYIHPQWRQCASDEGGTRTGRMAAANPNPQQVPAGKYRKTGKPNEFGKLIRSCFIPHIPGLKWAKYDYSAQEPRILVHFAELCNCTGAKLAAMRYRTDRKFDIYQLMVDAAGIDRRPAKDCYLGRCYGMGKKKMAYKLNKSLAEAEEILKKFDQGVPFVKEMAELCMSAASRRGYVKTLLGRRRHFNQWEPANSWDLRERGVDCRPTTEEAAKIKWPGERLQRANTHKALNAVIQGSAADMTKMAIIQCWEQHKILPYMQVHDELNFGVEQGLTDKLQETIETCVKMQVPIVSDASIGEHWK